MATNATNGVPCANTVYYDGIIPNETDLYCFAPALNGTVWPSFAGCCDYGSAPFLVGGCFQACLTGHDPESLTAFGLCFAHANANQTTDPQDNSSYVGYTCSNPLTSGGPTSIVPTKMLGALGLIICLWQVLR